MTAPTESLPDILLEVHQGRRPQAAGLAALQAYRGALDQILQNYLLSKASLTEQVVATCQPSLQRVERQLTELRDTAEQARSALEAGDLRILLPLAEQIRATTESVNASLGTYREATLVAAGPTSLGGVNRIIQAVLAWGQHPEAPPSQEVAVALEQEVKRVQSWLLQSPEPPALERVLLAYQKALLDMQEPLTQGNFEEMEGPWKDWLDQVERLQGVLTQLPPSQRVPPPPRSYAHLEALIQSARSYRQGRLEEADLEALLLGLQQDLSCWRERLASLAGSLARSSTSRELVQSIDAGYANFERLLAQFAAAARADGEQEFEKCCQALSPGWDRVSRLQKELQAALEAQQQRLCPRCGQVNSSAQRNCTSCGIVLPTAL